MPSSRRSGSRTARSSLNSRQGRLITGVIVLLVLLAVAVYERWQTPTAPTPIATTSTSTGDQRVLFGPNPAAVSDWYEIHFTSPRYPDDQSDHRGGPDEALVALMDRAKTTLDVADYDFDLSNVADAMVRATQRGVGVRMVTDTDTLENKDEHIQAALKKLTDAKVPIVDDKESAIMHDKFTIVDGEWVSTGSMNYTDGDAYRLNNWLGIFHSRELAANYTAEFEQMFSGEFGHAKANLTPKPTLTIGATRVESCFAPKGKCADLIVKTIDEQARKSLFFMAFSFTHDGIGSAMVDRHKNGVKVVGVFEKTGSQTRFSEYERMKKDGVEVYLDGNPYSMHHKVILVDDRIVIAGSFNFSANADEDNDENLLVFDDPEMASAFKAEFDRVLYTAQNPPAQKTGN